MVKVAEKKKSPPRIANRKKLHCGLCQRGAAVERMFIRAMTSRQLVIHPFNSLDQLYEHNQRSYIDLVLLASGPETSWVSSMIRAIKTHSALQFIPIFVYAPKADKKLIVGSYRQGADDVLAQDWDDEIVEAKIEMLLTRSERDLSVNPTTKLPGTNAIEFEIEKRLQSGEKFAVCYADLDDFKAYNDYYGYVYGDKMIRITSHIIRNVVHDLTSDGFVGHIGGDDFIFLIPFNMIEPVCKNIIATFDRMAPYRYPEEDRERGWIEVPNRRGVMERFGIMTISIAVIVNQKRMFKHPGEMSHMMADLKKYTKSLPGSNYMIERRKKY